MRAKARIKPVPKGHYKSLVAPKKTKDKPRLKKKRGLRVGDLVVVSDFWCNDRMDFLPCRKIGLVIGLPTNSSEFVTVFVDGDVYDDWDTEELTPI